MCVAFTAGKDVGYSRGVTFGTESEYVNGINDGVRTCMEAIFDRIENNNRVESFPEQDGSEETL